MRKRTLVTWLAMFLLGCLISISSAACSPQKPAASEAKTGDRPLVVGVQPWIGFRGQYIAMAKDMFRTEGVNVKEVYLQAATDTNNALIAGKVDLAWVGGADLLTLVSRAPSLKIIMVSDYSNGADGILGRNISKPEEMKGKKVAREDAPYAIVFLNTYLAKAGLTEKDVKVVSLSAGDAMVAFVANKVDAATSYEPWLSQVVQKAKANIVFTSKNTNVIPIVLATRTEVIQNRRETILAYLKTIDKALTFADSHPQDAAKIVAKKLGVTPEEIPGQLAGIRPFNVEGNKTVPFNSSSPLSLVKSLYSASKTLYKLGKIPQPIDAKTLVDDSLIKAL